jgi:hypothetical protein
MVSEYNFGMTLPDFLRLLANTPKEKHFALIAWFSTQKNNEAERALRINSAQGSL